MAVSAGHHYPTCCVDDNFIPAVTGEYSCLKVELIFKREFSYYLITIYVPCCMLVIVSWVSFWLDQHAIPARWSLNFDIEIHNILTKPNCESTSRRRLQILPS